MQRNKLMGVVALLLCIGMMIPSVSAQAATTIYNEKTGVEDGYDYALWKDYGDTSMTLNGGGNFSCWWDNIGNALFRKGKTFDCTKTYSQIGTFPLIMDVTTSQKEILTFVYMAGPETRWLNITS